MCILECTLAFHAKNVREGGDGQVLSSAKIGTASWRYYADGVACRAADYYAGLGEAPGRWHGQGLEPLGLTPGGLVHVQQLEALIGRALHPVSGTQLGRAWRADGVTGFDLTFSAPKSVSALWALGDPYTATAVMAAHKAAVRAGLAYLDSHAALSRRGTDGVVQVGTEGLAAALFDHRTSRAGDPQLHTHALVINKAFCDDGAWRSLDATELFHHKKSAGMIYQAAVRNELHRRLEVTFYEPNVHGQAEIVGVPTGLLELWSKRTAHITAEATPKVAEYEALLGRALTDAERVKVVKTAVLKTRSAKQHTELSALHATWTAEAHAAGWTQDRLLRSVRGPAEITHPPAEPDATEAALVDAVQAAGLRRAVFSRGDLAGQVAARLPTSGLTALEVTARVEQLTDRALALTETVALGDHPRGVTERASDARYATVQVLTAEARVLSLAARGRRVGYAQVPMADLTAYGRVAGMDPAQHAALLHLAGDGDFVSVLTAPAGAGKTTTLGAAAAVWERAGYRVVGLAPSARAAAELAAATGGHTDTLAKWLHTQDRHADGGRLPPDLLAWTRLDDRTVLIVDEASMASTLDLDRLTALAARDASKVVLVGDPGQIGVINGPGGMLAALAHDGHGIELTEIHRFQAQWERHASLQLRAGDRQALIAYGRDGRLHPCADGDTALDGAFGHWASARAGGQDALMLARSRVDVDALNSRARDAALAAGDVHGPVVTAGGRDWQAGDVLRARRNDRQFPVGDSHVRNGDRYRVLGPGPDGGLNVEDLAGRGCTVLPAAYLAEHAEYGWASTIDAAQGATTDVGIVLVRPGIDREHLYVGMTRGRHANHAYITPDTTLDEMHLRPVPRSGIREGVAGDDPGDAAAIADAVKVLAAALAQTGAQDAAHTVLRQARLAAVERQVTAETDRQAVRARQVLPDRSVPDHHARAAEQLRAQQQRLDLLRAHRAELQQDMWAAGRDLADCPRWNRSRKRSLTLTITADQQALRQGEPLLATVNLAVDRLSVVVRQHDNERTTHLSDAWPVLSRSELLSPGRSALPDLAVPRGQGQPVGGSADPGLHPRSGHAVSRHLDSMYPSHRDRDLGRGI